MMKIKYGLKKSSYFCCILAIFFMIICILGMKGKMVYNAYADNDSYYKNAGKQYVYDQAGIFDNDEIEALANKCRSSSEWLKIDMVIATTNNTGNKSTLEYADDFMDDNQMGYEDDDRWDKSCVMLLFDFDNSEVYIDTTGLGILCVEDDDIEAILDDVFLYIPSKDYYRAAYTFLDSAYNVIIRNKSDYANEYIDDWENFDGTYEDFYHNYVNVSHNIFYRLKNPFISLFLALMIAGISILIMSYDAKPRMTVDRDTYLNRRNRRIHLATDRYLTTTTTKHRISSGGSGSGGGHGGSFHSSGGGHSHGGGGRHM